MSISFQELINEFARRNAGTGGGGKRAGYVQDKKSNTPVGYIQDRPKKGGEGIDKEKAAAAHKKQAKLDRIAAAKERASSK